MIENYAFFLDMKECSLGYVTFRDIAKGKVLGIGAIIKLADLPRLQDVRLVEGFSANLINISQLCDQGFQVSYSRYKCEVLSKGECIVMSGTRLFDNFYHWDPYSEKSVCN